jgi:hypothetical protein
MGVKGLEASVSEAPFTSIRAIPSPVIAISPVFVQVAPTHWRLAMTTSDGNPMVHHVQARYTIIL